MTAEETLNLVAKQWCTLEDIMKLGHLGRNSALKAKKKIKDKLEKQGYQVPEAFECNNTQIPGYWAMKYTSGERDTYTIDYEGIASKTKVNIKLNLRLLKFMKALKVKSASI